MNFVNVRIYTRSSRDLLVGPSTKLAKATTLVCSRLREFHDGLLLLCVTTLPLLLVSGSEVCFPILLRNSQSQPAHPSQALNCFVLTFRVGRVTGSVVIHNRRECVTLDKVCTCLWSYRGNVHKARLTFLYGLVGSLLGVRNVAKLCISVGAQAQKVIVPFF